MSAHLDDDIEEDDDFTFDIEDDDTEEVEHSAAEEDDDLDEIEDEEEDEELAGFSEEQRRVVEKLVKRREEDRAAAIEFANKTLARATRAEEAARSATKAVVGEAKTNVEREIADLKREYREALETEDHEKAADINEKLAEAVQKKRMVQAAEQDADRQPVETDQEIPPLRARWLAENDWYDMSGETGDMEMSAVAFARHVQLVKKGVRPDTKEYFEAIDKRVREVFPDKFGGRKQVQQKPTGKPKMGGAPVVRKGSGGGQKETFRMTPSMRNVARSLGLTDKEYAQSYREHNKDND